MNNSPLVSIIIPVYNGSNYMREAIDSALNQTYDNIEVLVINDGSTDETESIALSYGDKIRYYKKENGGVSTALNYGLKMMKGDFFSWLSHDDKYLPEKIETQVKKYLELNDKKVIVKSHSCNIDCDSNIVAGNKKEYKNVNLSEKDSINLLLSNGSLGGCNLLIPKEVFDKCGGFNEKLRYIQDFDMWLRILTVGFHIYEIAEIDVCNRIHNGQLTQTGRKLFRDESMQISENIINKLSAIDSESNKYIFTYLLYNAKQGNREIVNKYLHDRSSKKFVSTNNRISISVMKFYGLIRPFIRRVLYRLIINVKTN